ncbi:flagellar basal body-associated protein FliL [Peribacillus asahii]|uniref:flagellar basal body-associated protein FliL n=1 Tax=Peribacillus asahii TaxID=228899 RepID=UPI002079AA2D|nr:flagellar basal body-associated protein FliL [Peribacillus asahii]USK71649.1 flagellar basal body-associated protein FliL [Peribacillus asahii]
MKNKVLTIMLIMLVAISLLGVLAVVVINKMNDAGVANGEPSIDEIVEASVEIPEITTNLADNDYIKISFTIQTDGKKAKEELEKRNFQAKNIIITELSEVKTNELAGRAGKEKLQEVIKKELNELMQEGQVEQVYITSSILQ